MQSVFAFGEHTQRECERVRESERERVRESERE
jgi:hypothetical protein